MTITVHLFTGVLIAVSEHAVHVLIHVSRCEVKL